MASVTIRRGTTAIYLDCLSSGRLSENDSVSIFKFLQSYLTEYEYDYRNNVNRAKYYYYKYDKAKQLLSLPINIQSQLEKFLQQNLVNYSVEQIQPIDAYTTNLKNIGSFKDRDYQVKSIDFLSKPGMRALELQTGCLVGDTTNIRFYNGKKNSMLSLEDAYKLFTNAKTNSYTNWFSFVPKQVLSYDGKHLIVNDIKNITYSGIKECVRLVFDDKTFIESTLDHLFLTELGWIEAKDILNQEILGAYEYFPTVVVGRPVVEIIPIGLKKTYDIECASPNHNFLANRVIAHNSGKTYVAIRSILDIQKRAMIVVPASLMDQWQEALSNMTNANIDILRGSKSIYSLIKKDYQTETDVFLASVNTLQEYANGSSVYNVLPSMNEFVSNLGIGIKIIDEVHINFNSNTLIDISCGNILHNIYLSATYIRSSRSSNLIFKRIFPEEVKYDGDRDYNRYVNITETNYSFGAIDEKSVMTERGYSQYKYEKYLMKRVTKLNFVIYNVFFPVINDYFVNIRKAGEKLLIIVGMQEFAEILVNYIRDYYQDLNTITFLYGTKDEAIDDADVIVSTTGSCGTGKDISNLRSMILFTSFSSDALTMQTLGRLRKIENTPEFIYLVNKSIIAQCRHAHTKRKVYKFVGLTFKSIDI